MKISPRLLKEIPLGKRDTILEKIEGFEKVLLENKPLKDIPKGYWIRNVKGTEIYKFRVNSGDRILFRYKKIDGKDSIVFLDYCTHDKQIRVARAINKDIKVRDLKIDKNEYIEDDFDKEIEEYIKSEEYAWLDELKKYIIEDEYISLSIDEDDLKDMNYLSLEQYNCLKNINKPTLVLGCAGSGKTMLAKQKIIMNNTNSVNTAYVTCSNLLVEKIKNVCLALGIKNTDNIKYYTLRDLCLKILSIDKDKIIIEYDDFINWIILNRKLEDIDLNPREIWVEINTKIKGYTYGHVLNNMISEKEYLQLDSQSYDIKTKKYIYRIAFSYQNWLITNNYLDDNDLSYMIMEYSKQNDIDKFDYIIYDEVQELSQRQLMILPLLVSNLNNLMILGDLNQSINIDRFDIAYLKNIIYENQAKLDEKFIFKNYRNGEGIIKWLNEFHKIKNSRFKSIGKILEQGEEAIKEGVIPNILHNINESRKIFDKVEKSSKSVIVVVDKFEREQLEKRGYKIGRVFTIDEIRGLEYDNIYCYNLMSSFSRIWDFIIKENIKHDSIYAIYFNIIYIATTRAKRQLCFIESEKTELEKRMNYYLYEIKNIDTSTKDIYETKDVNEWIREAKKLEEMGKYFQASEAYKKANKFSDANICMLAGNRKISYENMENFSTFISIRSDNISGEIDTIKINFVLDLIFEMYNVKTWGIIITNLIYNDVTGGSRLEDYFDTNTSNLQISKKLSEHLSKSHIYKQKIILKVCFYKDDMPIDMSSILGENLYDIQANFSNNKLSIIPYFDKDERLLDAFMNKHTENHYENIGLDTNKMYIDKIRNKSKYDKLTSQDILNSIFGEK